MNKLWSGPFRTLWESMASSLVVGTASEPEEESADAHGAKHDSNRRESKEPVKLRLPKLPTTSGSKRGLQELEGAVDAESQPQPSKRSKIDSDTKPQISSTIATDVPMVHSAMAAPRTEDHHEQQREWSREAGLRTTPEVMPTFKPKHPAEIRQEGEKRWVVEQMNNIREDIGKAVRAYFAKHGVDEGFDSRFIQNPSTRLLQLYRRLFGEDWIQKVKHLRNEGHVLRQFGIVTGLFGAAIHEWAFLAALPWDLGKDLETALGPNLQYLQAVLRDMGHDYGTFISNVVGKQIGSNDFRGTAVASYAKQRVEEIAAAMLEHQRALEKGAPFQTTRTEDWRTFLQRAFETAIGVKQVLRSSSLSKFVVSFGNRERKYYSKQHRLLHNFPDTEMVLHSAISGVVRVREGERVWFSKEVVVPMVPESKTAAQAIESVTPEAQADR